MTTGRGDHSQQIIREIECVHQYRRQGADEYDEESLCVQPATVTKMLDRLVKTRLVQRMQDSDDQRVSRVYLTEKGRELLEPIEQVWEELEQISFADLSLAERRLLRRLLLQVHENLGGND